MKTELTKLENILNRLEALHNKESEYMAEYALWIRESQNRGSILFNRNYRLKYERKAARYYRAAERCRKLYEITKLKLKEL